MLGDVVAEFWAGLLCGLMLAILVAMIARTAKRESKPEATECLPSPKKKTRTMWGD